jgi:hypothetical protein
MCVCVVPKCYGFVSLFIFFTVYIFVFLLVPRTGRGLSAAFGPMVREGLNRFQRCD